MALKQVGVEFVAEGAEQFTADTQTAGKAEAEFVNETKAAAASTAELETISVKERDAMLAMGISADYIAKNFNVETAEVRANTEAVEQNTVAETGNADAVAKTTAAHVSNFTVMREGRLVMGMMIADMALMQLTAGQTNPQLQELGKSLQVVVETGMMGFMATGNIVVGVAVALGAALFTLGQIASQADPEIVALNKDLDNLAKHDDAAAGLAKLAGVTNDEAQAALDAAKKNPEYAASLKQLADEAQNAYDPLNELKILLQQLGIVAPNISVDKLKQSILETNVIIGPYVKQLEMWKSVLDEVTGASQRTEDATQKLRDAVETLPMTGITGGVADDIDKASADADKAIQKLVGDEQTALADIAKAQRDADASREQSRRQLAEQMQQIAFEEATAEIKYQQDVAKANQEMDDAIAKANRDLNDALTNDAQKLADAEYNAQRTLADALNDLAYEHQKKEAAIAQEIANVQIEAAQSVANAQRTELEQLAAEDWNVKHNLESAKTENEKEQILERATFDRATIRQHLSDAVADADARITNEERVAATKTALEDADYAHSKDIDTRRYGEQLADAIRTYDEEVAQAQRHNAEMVADAEQRNAQQLADLQQNLANEQRLLEHQREVAEQNNRDRIADLDARLAREIQDIDARYEREREDIWATASEAVAAYMQIYAAMNEIQQVMSLGLEGNPDVAAAGLESRDTGGAVMGGKAYYVGTPEIFVPQSAGTMIPLNQVSNSFGGHTITFNINGATNPEAVWDVFQRRLAQEAWR